MEVGVRFGGGSVPQPRTHISRVPATGMGLMPVTGHTYSPQSDYEGFSRAAPRQTTDLPHLLQLHLIFFGEMYQIRELGILGTGSAATFFSFLRES